MSAEVLTTSWGWWCDECADGSEITFDSKVRAERDAREHDQEHHS